MKKILTLFLTLIIVSSVTVPAFAAPIDEPVGILREESAPGPRRLPVTTKTLLLNKKNWTVLFDDNNLLPENVTITNVGGPGSIYVHIVAYDKDGNTHTIVDQSTAIPPGLSYDSPTIKSEYKKYVVSLKATVDGSYTIRYHD